MDRGSPVIQAEGGVGGGMNPGSGSSPDSQHAAAVCLRWRCKSKRLGLLEKMRGEVFPEPEMKKAG
ncbi:hypothetical protein WK86_05815 [Burkholderia cepacia]|nr:hypothetical protein WK83_23865 [Burkholderia cepacia]KVV85762.1 hypothetical protein WK87_21300 [Burkholderia cepacia]KVV88184.1 hypothetical protein WK86_05815 [Burkholderia cepacia]KVV91306.1 hypothetical protein WK88_21835 [Burkholderia cepacia]KVV99528.1 hypothetical protein WK89_19960 [Burkholderia cepacia]